jgi:iron complex transport system substrate-binding protein
MCGGSLAARSGVGTPRTTFRWAVATICALAATQASADRLPRVASINLCADELVLSLAAPEQILSVSWLAADAEESMLAREASRYPLNYGSAEQILRLRPDVVIAGVYTSPFTRGLLKRLGIAVLELTPGTTLADIETNLRLVGAAIDRREQAEALIADMRVRARRIVAARPDPPVAGVVVRPGGFTVGRHSLAATLMTLAGIRNVAAEQGLDQWGSLSMETLLRSRPQLLVVTRYRQNEPSLANAVLAHPALTSMSARHETTEVRAAYWACGLPASLESSAELEQAARGQ